MHDNNMPQHLSHLKNIRISIWGSPIPRGVPANRYWLITSTTILLGALIFKLIYSTMGKVRNVTITKIITLQGSAKIIH